MSDRLRRRGVPRTAVTAAALLCMTMLTAAMGATVQAHGPAWLLAALVFATSFFIWGGWAPIYATMAELFPPRVLGIAYGLLNAICFLSALAAPYVTGWIRDRTGSFAGGCYAAAVIGLLGVPVVLAVRSGRHAERIITA